MANVTESGPSLRVGTEHKQSVFGSGIPNDPPVTNVIQKLKCVYFHK